VPAKGEQGRERSGEEAEKLRPVREWMSHISEDVSMEQGDVVDRVDV
jgi:hypothetical protein